ncbi:hypothetical protein, partial [Methylocaldum sp. 14B]|uniref:hypothetical protein n=1 Tax=Methylocaldum sp. 14B TaxID=1912213 RepID=UPI00197BF88F
HQGNTNIPVETVKEALIKSFDRLRTNGNVLIPFVVSPSTRLRTGLSNALLSLSKGHERNPLVQSFLKT